MTIDLHLDTLWKMTKYGDFQISEGRNYSDVNTASLAKGGLNAGVFALYLAQHYEVDSERLIGEQIAFFKEQRWPAGFKPYLAMENGELLRGKLANLDMYAKAGIVYLTLTHNYDNHLGCSATDSSHVNEGFEGISKFGETVVRRCNYLNVFVDISHSTQRTALDVIEISDKPIIASHSGCQALSDHPRNITDFLIREIATTGGLVGIPFVKNFIGTRDAIADHIDHIAQLVGIKHIAIGSDIDGAVMADDVEMACWHDSFAEGLTKRGYTNDDITLVAGGNFKRLLALMGK